MGVGWGIVNIKSAIGHKIIKFKQIFWYNDIELKRFRYFLLNNMHISSLEQQSQFNDFTLVILFVLIAFKQ